MKYRCPDYFKQFRCIGGGCSDNCCIGWEIDIDRETEKYYCTVEGNMGVRLKRCISSEGSSHFILENERCPFLNQDNLCDIILELGEDRLCEICREHPRFYETFGEWEEKGLGLCCEEAARLILQNHNKAGFEIKEDGRPGRENLEKEWINGLLYARQRIFELLQNREREIWERLTLAFLLAEELQAILDGEEPLSETEKKIRAKADTYGSREMGDKILETVLWERDDIREERLEKILEFYEELEPIDGLWPERIKRMKTRLPELLKQEENFYAYYKNYMHEYEHLAVYFIYRYFMKACYDGDIISKAGLAVISCLFLWLMDIDIWTEKGKFTLEEQIEAAKAYSKEIEYSEENLECLGNAFWEDGCFAEAFFSWASFRKNCSHVKNLCYTI